MSPERKAVRSKLAVVTGVWFLVVLLAAMPLVLLSAHATTSALSFPTRGPGIPEAPAVAESTKLLDAKGRLIAMLHGDEHRIVVERKQIPNIVRSAVVAVEDERFYDHQGVDGNAIVRSFLTNVRAGEVEQGGSTITQQYVRNTFQQVGRETSLKRKVREALFAIQIERKLEKDEILHGYLNAVYFGRGTYGIEAAALTYFGKPALKVTLPEAAALAAIVRGPQMYERNLTLWKERRDYVLRRMQEAGFISIGARTAAAKTPLTVRPDAGPSSTGAYFVEYVRRQLTTPVADGGFGLSQEQVLRGGLTVQTTLDLDLQKTAERAVASVLNRASDPEVGFVVMATSGEVRAMVGGRDFDSVERARGFNFAAQTSRGSGRPAGSTFKPFTLAAYLDAGLTPLRTYSAPSKIAVKQCEERDGPWTPSNYGRQGFGRLSVVQATEKSVNTVYAQMVGEVDPAQAMRMAQLAGIESRLLPVCSITLGTMGVTPLEMARAYATFAARGVRPNVLTVTKIVGAGGTLLIQRNIDRTAVIKRETADGVNAILKGVVERGTGRPARTIRTAAGKTGTTDDFRDVWFVGYTPHPGLSAAVWIGYPPDKRGNIRSMLNVNGRRATGGGLAGSIWKGFMDTALVRAAEIDFAPITFKPPPRPKVVKPAPEEGFVYLGPNEVYFYAPPPEEPGH